MTSFGPSSEADGLGLSCSLTEWSAWTTRAFIVWDMVGNLTVEDGVYVEQKSKGGRAVESSLEADAWARKEGPDHADELAMMLMMINFQKVSI